jgi:hypothetical protein
MARLAYRLKNPVTVVLRQADRYRLIQLRSGSVFWTTGSKPDANGMIDGICNDDVVLMFARDLEERTEPLTVEAPHLRVYEPLLT